MQRWWHKARMGLVKGFGRLTLFFAAACGMTAAAPQPRDAYADALSAARVLAPSMDPPVVIYTARIRTAGGYEFRGSRVVAINPAYLETVTAAYGHAAAVGVCVHELAHLPALREPFAPLDERYQDAVAGCAIAVLGLEVDGFESLLRAESTESRARAARRGWTTCDRDFPK